MGCSNINGVAGSMASICQRNDNKRINTMKIINGVINGANVGMKLFNQWLSKS
jgi:uncharacterized membrane protein YeaQ/YmgE (transglycosylase-associated protein family)